jgi:hypothetical protein
LVFAQIVPRRGEQHCCPGYGVDHHRGPESRLETPSPPSPTPSPPASAAPASAPIAGRSAGSADAPSRPRSTGPVPFRASATPTRAS